MPDPDAPLSPDLSRTPSPTQGPHPARAVAGLLVNVVVLPGLGTLISRDPRRKRVGWVQLGLGVILVPLIAIVTSYGWTPAGLDSQQVRSWLSNFMFALALWSAITSFLIIWDAWRAERHGTRGPKGA